MQSSVRQNNEVIMIDGAVTFETVAAIQKSIEHLLQCDQFAGSRYQINLESVTLVNSAALGLLVELKKATIAHKKMIVFLNAPRRLLSLAQVCGVSDWLGLL